MSDMQSAQLQAAESAGQSEPSRIDDKQPDQEIELKLTAERESLSEAWTSRLLATRAGHEAVKQLETVYYDTPDQRLRRRGLALRVRKDGTRFTQTVKTEANGASALLTRGEFSCSVPSDKPDLKRIQDPELKRHMGLILPAELEPVFTTRIERRSRKLRRGGRNQPKAVIEVALDDGEVVTKAGRKRLAELELELVEGSSEVLYDLARKLVGETPLSLQTVSKSDWGYALARGERPHWVKAADPSFPHDITLDRALDGIFRSCIRHWLANHAPVLEDDDPEGVHQLRVALRRLRSALSVFKTILPPEDAAWINTEARWLIQSLGPARDWDVFLTELMPPLQTARPDSGDLAALADAAEDARKLGYERARTALRSGRYTAFVLDLERWTQAGGWHDGQSNGRFEEPLTDYACRLLRKRHKRVLKEGRDFENLSDEKRHELRITLKKLRYTCEFFASLYPQRKTQPYLKALKSLQDELGHLNDVVVAEDLLESLHGSADGSNTAALRAAAGMVIGWYSSAIDAARPAMVRRWADFAASDPFWTRG